MPKIRFKIKSQEGSLPPPHDRLSSRDARVLSRSYGEEVEEGWMLCCLTTSAERDFVPWPPSIEATCWCGLVASLLLVVAMAAPYWLVSWEDTESPFLRMGPWEACFYRWGPVSDVSTVGFGESSSKRVVRWDCCSNPLIGLTNFQSESVCSDLNLITRIRILNRPRFGKGVLKSFFGDAQ